MAKLEATVKQFLEEGRMFTAYDVTIETRTREKMMLRHSDVSGACHEIEALVDAMDFGYQNSKGQQAKWQRTSRDIPGGRGAWAWIYHPTNLDANSYQFRNNQQQPQAQPAAKPAGSISSAPATPALSLSTDGNTSDSGGEQDDGTFAVDFRNRLMIPTRFMREAGISAGDQCYVIPDASTNTVLICKDTPALQAGGVKMTTQKVEQDGELRLSSRTLRAADLTDNKFVIETTDKDFSGTTAKVVAVKKSA
jgi:hypothetical protein